MYCMSEVQKTETQSTSFLRSLQPYLPAQLGRKDRYRFPNCPAMQALAPCVDKTADVIHAHDPLIAGEAALQLNVTVLMTHPIRDMMHASATFEVTSDASVGPWGPASCNNRTMMDFPKLYA